MKLLPAIDIALSKNFPFAAYRLPEKLQFNFVMQNGDDLAGPSERCFVFHPFDENGDTPAIYLKADHVCSQRSFGHCEKLADKLQLQSGYPRTREKRDSDTPMGTHLERVKEAISKIEKGEFDKTVVARIVESTRGKTSISKLLESLAKRYPSAFVCVFNHPKAGTWVCATPETLVKSKSEKFETMSLAGTIPVGEESPSWSGKEKDEQQIVTTDIQAQLEKAEVSQLKTSRVETIKAGNVHHLRSKIRFKSEKSILEIAKLLHPTPAVNGYPREASMDFILKNEKTERKYYSGFLGPVGLHDTNHLFVNLRCMEVFEDQFLLHVGGGITADSDPQLEWEETVHKAETLTAVIEKLRT